MPRNGTRPPFRFPLGKVFATPGALSAMMDHPDGPGIGLECLLRHATGDWGDMDAEDKHANEEALRVGARIFSAYIIAPGVKLWVITESDRSSTTILTPDEY
jgi:hypothetical protein